VHNIASNGKGFFLSGKKFTSQRGVISLVTLTTAPRLRKKNCAGVIFNNSAKHWPILIILAPQYYEEKLDVKDYSFDHRTVFFLRHGGIDIRRSRGIHHILAVATALNHRITFPGAQFLHRLVDISPTVVNTDIILCIHRQSL